ncbi:T9SS type A sorting domain-containing protein [Dyadobacter pollutisoli]|uniref:T9SS type A sorting domain-containing protein n=1 Tax=Dyadobacter pollutisoli TaxID=2910158 RepID=A0A9E8NFR1_9BACT|nr:T9SS type A sorting domain-containing protein [Dyadobacter pollutisoli]WAC13751.1 T9SS type A sorting domain-containing protein [Dyadobacter pollutisoli]
MRILTLTIALIIAAQWSFAQQISPSGIYGAASQSTVGNLSVNWVIGTLTPTSLSALPVRLISFKGQLTSSGNAELEWKTTQEVNNKGFEIQKSVDGKVFDAIGWVDGGNQESEKIYRFTDAKLITTSYYRLKQIDFDEKFTLSRIVSVVPENESLDRFVAFPNPSPDGKVEVKLPERISTMELVDITGKVIIAKQNPATKQIITLPKTGLFFLRIQGIVGEKTIKAVKN